MHRPLQCRGVILALAGLALSGACAWRTPELAVDIRPEAQSSKVFAADGALLATLHAEQNREDVPLDRVAAHLRDAVVAIEDERFWEHNGVDARAVARAVFANADAGEVIEGGSTITQQYVKNELVGRDRNVRRKLREAALAYEVERTYTKERILELYLNSIYFGNGAYGVQAAAQVYFGRDAEQLTLAQSALLAGVIRAPTTNDPFVHPDQALFRRRVVLDKLVALGRIDPAAAEAATGEPIGLRPASSGERLPAPHFMEKVKRFILDDERFGATPGARRQALFQGGLRITTTLDLEQQQQAEGAVAKVLSKPGTDPEAAVVTIDPTTGAVRALVGGRDFYGTSPSSKFDLATQGRRPAGSAFKPFVLTAALERGIGLSKVYDAPSRLSLPLTRSTWEVDNYEGSGGGRENLLEATVHSTNTVYARLILEVGPTNAVDMAHRLGITSPLTPVPSAVLGTNDVTPFEMAVAYGTLANRGLANAPTVVSKVEAADGTILYQHQPTPKRVLEPPLADATVAVLQQVVQRGTGVQARIGRPVAGKTGTGQEWRDAWFVGFTPELVTAVWVGFPESQVSMVPPTTRIRVTGGSWPAQIWQLYMTAALARVPITHFPSGPIDAVGSDEAPTLIVPNAIGMPAEQAEQLLSREGLRAVRKRVPSDEYPPGYVIGQSPPPGADAPGGSDIALEVASGPASAIVPDVLEQDPAAARARITEGGLKAKVITTREPPSATAASRAGLVWKQSPPASTRVDPGSTVTIYVNPA